MAVVLTQLCPHHKEGVGASSEYLWAIRCRRTSRARPPFREIFRQIIAIDRESGERKGRKGRTNNSRSRGTARSSIDEFAVLFSLSLSLYPKSKLNLINGDEGWKDDGRAEAECPTFLFAVSPISGYCVTWVTWLDLARNIIRHHC